MVRHEGVLVGRGPSQFLLSRQVREVELFIAFVETVLGFREVTVAPVGVCEVHHPRKDGMIVGFPDTATGMEV